MFFLYNLLLFQSDHIRTIIKARGISWQQVAGSGIPTTFAVFRVDAKHHLVSLAAKLAPSPDWIVGVSALELCNANCTWRRSTILPLYPYDAGTDNGISYTVSIYFDIESTSNSIQFITYAHRKYILILNILCGKLKNKI